MKWHFFLKFMFSKKATNIDKIFTVNLTGTTYTLLIAEILSGKNARAWVSMDFT